MSTQSLKPGWKMVKFGDIAQNVAVRVDSADAKTDVYVGLEHLSDIQTACSETWFAVHGCQFSNAVELIRGRQIKVLG